MPTRRSVLGPLAHRPMTERPGNHRPPAAIRAAGPITTEPSDPLGRDPRLARLEAVLFLADEPLPARRLAAATGWSDGTAVRQGLEQLRRLYEADGSAFQILELAGGYQLLTRPAYHPWLLRLRRTGHDVRLTPTALETLAVIAYKQPITRADVEAIRGVGCGEMIRLLLEKGLVRVGGRHDSLGRPQLYVTTKRFLQVFGLNTLDQLPEVDSLRNPG